MPSTKMGISILTSQKKMESVTQGGSPKGYAVCRRTSHPSATEALSCVARDVPIVLRLPCLFALHHGVASSMEPPATKCAKVQFWIRNFQGTLVVRLKNKITRSTWFGVELRDVESRRWLWLVNLQMRCSTLLGWVKGC